MVKKMKFRGQKLWKVFIIIILLQITIAVIIWTKELDTTAPQTFLNTLHETNSTNDTRKIQPGLNSSIPHGKPRRNVELQLADSVHNVCASMPKSRIIHEEQPKLHYTPDGAVRFCPIEKIGSTYWRRVFYMVASKGKSKFKTPYDVPASVAIAHRQGYKPRNHNNQSEFSFLFVRDPFSRLLSTFIDKLVPPNPMFWNRFGKPAVTKFRLSNGTVSGQSFGHDVTFTEFVKFATDMEISKGIKDVHIQSMRHVCLLCAQSYTFIGRMERFKNDAFYVMKKMGVDGAVQSMNSTFEQRAEDDAIADTLTDPFTWKRTVIKVIPWEKALQRLWLKLQMRGLISKDIKLKLTDHMVKKMSRIEFIQLARKAHSESDPVKLKQQKELVKKEAFASVPLSVLKQFVSAFYDDFLLFGYDPFPSKYFDRDEKPIPPSIFFNYSHLN